MTQLELNSDFEDESNDFVTYFADVILPIPLPGTYTYRVPRDMQSDLEVGCRVIVQFGKKKILTGVVAAIHSQAPKVYEAKLIMESLDGLPSVNAKQLELFRWMAKYYMCTIGEVLNAALPSGLKLNSESFIQLNPDFNDQEQEFSDKEEKVLEALASNDRLTYEEVSQVLGIKMIHPVLKSLIQKGRILLYEQIKDKYKPKTRKVLFLDDKYLEDEQEMEQLFEQLEKRQKQQEVLLKYLSLMKMDEGRRVAVRIEKKVFMEAGLSDSALKTLIKNKVFHEEEEIVSRIQVDSVQTSAEAVLSNAQQKALSEIGDGFQANQPVLLHGITGSGKTEIYMELIRQALDSGGQVLYLLPEIALTTQIVSRLFKVFGSELGVFHSKYSDNERVEIWNQVNEGKVRLVVGVRSSLFLPFEDLSLIIVDEEHESSFKQYDPAPRYHARDSAIWLAQLHQSNVLLGTATPSLESYQNALDGKYKLVNLDQRFGEGSLPSFQLADVLNARKTKRMQGDFTPELIQEIGGALERKEQVILFQNRRGYSPYVMCHDCNHVPRCQSCDVSLTFHMHSNLLICHYCGYKEAVPAVCDACGSTAIRTIGVGTEKIEEDLKILFPEAHIERMDQDTTRSKYGYQNIIDRFENGETDILVGTQMLSKGLDFDRVSLVGIFDYDRIVHFPDFRSHERAFQLITQVSGRAGRKNNRGKVVIQTGETDGALLQLILRSDYQGFFQQEILERGNFNYPPFHRMIKVVLKHKEAQTVRQAASDYASVLIAELGRKRVLGPQTPIIGRIRNLYIEEIFVKLEKVGLSATKAKDLIYRKGLELKAKKEFASLRLYFDVDPV